MLNSWIKQYSYLHIYIEFILTHYFYLRKNNLARYSSCSTSGRIWYRKWRQCTAVWLFHVNLGNLKICCYIFRNFFHRNTNSVLFSCKIYMLYSLLQFYFLVGMLTETQHGLPIWLISFNSHLKPHILKYMYANAACVYSLTCLPSTGLELVIGYLTPRKSSIIL